MIYFLSEFGGIYPLWTAIVQYVNIRVYYVINMLIIVLFFVKMKVDLLWLADYVVRIC